MIGRVAGGPSRDCMGHFSFCEAVFMADPRPSGRPKLQTCLPESRNVSQKVTRCQTVWGRFRFLRRETTATERSLTMVAEDSAGPIGT